MEQLAIDQSINLSIYEANHYNGDKLPNTIDDYTWKEAVDDLRYVFEAVPVADLRLLLDKLNAGKINGDRGAVEEAFPYERYGACGCFIATLGHELITRGETVSIASRPMWSTNEFVAFARVYGHLDPSETSTAFQTWLFSVHPGKTPQNNIIARAFAVELQRMIDERTLPAHVGQ